MVQRSLSGGSAIARHPGDEGRAAVGLDADRAAGRPVDVNLRVDPRLLRQAGDDRAEPAVREPEDRHGRILDLDVRMVQVGPVAADLDDLVVHEPDQEVEHVGRLVHEDAAPLGVPLAPPGIGPIVGLVAPAIHGEGAEDRPADLARVDGLLHAPDRLVPPALADDTELDAVLPRRGEHRLAILEARRQRLLDQDVHAGLGPPRWPAGREADGACR